METIVTRHMAKQLVSKDYLDNPKLMPHRDVYQQGSHEIWIMLRHCWIRYSEGPEISGGLVVELTTRTYDHTGKSLKWVKRVKKGWTYDKVVKMVSRGIFELEQKEKLARQQEAFYHRADPIARNMDLEALDRLIDEAEAKGITAAYDAMGQEALDYWNKIF